MRITDIREIDDLTTSEKILLVEDLWDSIAADESGGTCSPKPQERTRQANAKAQISPRRSLVF